MADRKWDGSWNGEVFVDGAPRGRLFPRQIAYVRQDDVHLSTLTVEETLQYAAWTRLPEGTSPEARQQRVDDLLEMIGLSHVRKSIVGSAMKKGISGGQLKRLSIAVEIVPMPQLIFLDEPTSGPTHSPGHIIRESSLTLPVFALLCRNSDWLMFL